MLMAVLEESTTYQYLIKKGMDQGRNEGRNEGWNEGLQALRKIVVHSGTRRFGVPSTEKIASLQKIEDINRLELLAERIYEVQNWDELFAEQSDNR